VHVVAIVMMKRRKKRWRETRSRRRGSEGMDPAKQIES
jgi:hypothetical protein